MDQPPKHHPTSPAASDRRPASTAGSDRGLMILLVVLGLAFMLFVLFAGIVGLTP
jgi:hypothetical protein